MTELQKALEAAKYPVALTGAGISAPSGIPTFDMEWQGQPVRDFLSRQYYQENPLGFFVLLREMVKWRDKHPNYAHEALAHYKVSVITQNIDGLHQKSGSQKVIELHGNCERLVCRACGDTIAASRLLSTLDTALEQIVHCQKCGALLDSDVVLYGDDIKGWWQAVEEVGKADLLLVIGTSLATYPANQLPIMATRNGCQVIYINDDCLEAFRFYNEARKETFAVKGEAAASESFCRDCGSEWHQTDVIDTDYSKITRLTAYVGGHFGTSYRAVIDLANLETMWASYDSGLEENSRKSIRSSTARRFTDQLKAINLLDWKGAYLEPNAYDGTQWSLEIVVDGRTIQKHGSNQFPEEWDSCCRLIRGITKRRFR